MRGCDLFFRNMIIMRGCFMFLVSFLFLNQIVCLSQPSIILKDAEKVYQIDSSYFIQLDSIAPGKFVPSAQNPKLYFYNPDTEQAYWYRFKVSNQDDVFREWLLVSYNYSINEIDLIIYSDLAPPEKQFFRDTIGIYQRKIQHKQPVFILNFKPHETKTVYVRLKNESPYQYVFVVYSEFKFFSHFFIEYLEFGLFYGLMLFVLVYSLMNFIFLRDKVILIYTFFILSQTTYMLFRDGNGLYLVPNLPEYADLIKNIGRAAFAIFILLYTAYFLKINKRGIVFKFILAFIPFRIAYAFFTLRDSTFFSFHLEFSVILFCTILSISSFFRKNSDAKYMSIGLSLLSISYFVYYLTLIGMSALGPVSFFSLYYGMAFESIFMTIALTDRFRRVKLDNFHKEQMNKELEQLVFKRTELVTLQNKLLKEQTEELNLFLYSASHDLKGPLKTIDGLCNLAMLDKHIDHKEIYHLIKNRLQNLESNINDLNSVTRIKNAQSSNSVIDFKSLHEEIIKTFQLLPGFTDLQISLDIHTQHEYKADLFSVRCIYHNIFENAFKYRDHSKKPALMISIKETQNFIEIIFKDNGQGISKERLPFIFNMYYRANEDSKEDTGLGLYIVKLAVQKLMGKVSIESIPHVGTTISITLPLSKV
jgi:signal transduction histidine kinase